MVGVGVHVVEACLAPWHDKGHQSPPRLKAVAGGDVVEGQLPIAGKGKVEVSPSVSQKARRHPAHRRELQELDNYPQA